MDAALVILHLLLSFEPLVALVHLTLEFIFLLHLQVMQVNSIRTIKCVELYFARLDQSLNSTFIPKVRAAKLLKLLRLVISIHN